MNIKSGATKQVCRHNYWYGLNWRASCGMRRWSYHDAGEGGGYRGFQRCGSRRVDRLRCPSSCFRRSHRRGTWFGRRCFNWRSIART